jgi:CHAT domain-containing protein
MENHAYSVYEYNELTDRLNSITEPNTDVSEFLKKFTFREVTNQQAAKGNSSSIFKNATKEDPIKSKIISNLNKLSQHNLTKIISSIREIVFQTHDELNELVYQCIQKIKRENELTRPLIAALCWEFLSLYFVTYDNDKIYFRKLLLSEVKREYISSIDFNSDGWTKDKSDKVMILISTLYNGKIIDDKIMLSIINDLKKIIVYKENGTQEDYEQVEKSIQLLSCLVSSISPNEDFKKVFGDLDKFLHEQIAIYEDKKCISKKVRLVCKNIIYELTK